MKPLRIKTKETFYRAPDCVAETPKIRACRVCGCTDNDCSYCIERTGMACFWVGPDLCSACQFAPPIDLPVVNKTTLKEKSA